MRVVLDTNVVLSALLFPEGAAAGVRRGWQAQRFQPLISSDTAQELLRVLAYPKFRLTAEDREALLADYLPYCETVSMPTRLRGVPRCRDPHDREFLKLAIAGGAHVVVTGDADLMALKKRFEVPIVTIREFLDRIT